MDTFHIDQYFEKDLADEQAQAYAKVPMEELGRSSDAIWGLFKSKGLRKYQVLLNFKERSFHCNCSSLSNPCSHGIALYFAYKTNRYEDFKRSEDLPEWVQKKEALLIPVRQSKRDKRTPEQIADIKDKREKQREERLLLMQQGAEILENWLLDNMGKGLADLKMKGKEYWTDIAQTMVNHKLNGLSERILELERSLFEQEDQWYETALHQFSDWYLFVKTLSKLNTVPEYEKALLQFAGVKIKGSDLEVIDVRDRNCMVVKQDQWMKDGLAFTRILWIDVEKGDMFYTQEAVWKGGGAGSRLPSFKVGDCIRGDFVPYGFNDRYYLKTSFKRTAVFEFEHLKPFSSFDKAMDQFKNRLMEILFLSSFYFPFQSKGIIKKDSRYFLIDDKQKALAVDVGKSLYYKLLLCDWSNTILFLQWKNAVLSIENVMENDTLRM